VYPRASDREAQKAVEALDILVEDYPKKLHAKL
jgi:hypothetical protein